jgi:hypothetical protein
MICLWGPDCKANSTRPTTYKDWKCRAAYQRAVTDSMSHRQELASWLCSSPSKNGITVLEWLSRLPIAVHSVWAWLI